ncbi:hypothetical protein ES288_A03G102200v1 [Gossypium darwinii]|uniref:RING-type E3 ubiquitin transferase n=1 Tax=Gossypium darwinii TaxID=34276 RepID=A0A5D2H331_GOSDA|nr:hypothetical protein ES288_A03G102200v1 [Gossypium darwinii]
MRSRSLSVSEPQNSPSSSVSAELKLRADWSSLRMRTSPGPYSDLSISMAELGLKKEVREMLPVIIYKETFSIRDTQCAVCLGEYQAEDKLQQIPACGHTFHMDCIDHWLANHTTCPLCRLSVLTSSDKLPVFQAANPQVSSNPVNSNGLAVQTVAENCEETHGVQPLEQTIGDARISQHNSDEQECVNQGREFRNTRNEISPHEGSRGIAG